VRAIRNGDPPGRFLRKDEKSGLWVDVGTSIRPYPSFRLVRDSGFSLVRFSRPGDKKAAEKTSQALREKATEEREKVPGESSSGSAGLLVPVPATYLAATTANVMGNILASGTFTGSAENADNAEKSGDNEEKEGLPLLDVKDEPKEANSQPLQAMLDEVEV
jgi:hypothetical protein